jgi:hypothetical protein
MRIVVIFERADSSSPLAAALFTVNARSRTLRSHFIAGPPS